jgi:hypothetical protein
VTEASLRKFEELVFDHLVSTDETDAKDLFFVAQAMKTGLGSRKELVEMKRRQTEAVKAAEETVKAGGDGAAVAQRVREILGIKG